MSDTNRRLFLKPEGCSPEDCARLAQRLADAVKWQQRLAAKSPHVLHLIGTLQEDNDAFFVAHEPASPILDVSDLFSLSPTDLDEPLLMQLAAALFDALRRAHTEPEHGFTSHGALCPNVLLRSADGIEKISDFGFAQAVYSELGVDSYLHLAVGGLSAEGAQPASGIWEVLSPDEFERDDRICAFIDPEKYGRGSFEGFEPGSDIIAAGFLLHLIAEHRHPYLPDPDAHRMVEMAEFMGAGRYNGARRKELRESSDPGIRVWCDLVEKMLSRLPQNRPDANTLATSLSEFVKPIDAGELLRRRVESAAQLAEEEKWDELVAAVEPAAHSNDAPEDVVARANELLDLAKSHQKVGQALELIEGDAWEQAIDLLDEALTTSRLEGATLERAQGARDKVRFNLEAQGTCERVASTLDKAKLDESDPQKSIDELTNSVEALRGVAGDDRLFDVVNAQCDDVIARAQKRLDDWSSKADEIEKRRQEEAERLERERQADHDKANQWRGDLEEALNAGEWSMLADLLKDAPSITHKPDGFDDAIRAVRDRLKQHEEEERQREAMEADHARAEEWLSKLRGAVDGQKWDAAEKALQSKPPLTWWPDDVVEQERAFAETVKRERKKQADHAAAQQWIEKLTGLVEKEKWNDAADLLSARPSLEYWPEEVEAEQKRLSSEIESKLEALEWERRQIATWLGNIESAEKKQEWDEAIALVDAPPIPVDKLPKVVRGNAQNKRKEFVKERDAQIKRLVAERSDALQALVQSFVRETVAQAVPDLIDEASVKADVADEQFDEKEAFSGGQANLTVALGIPGLKKADPFSSPFRFVADGAKLRLADDAALRGKLTGHLKAAISVAQRERFGDVVAPLRKGAFPDTQIAVKLDEPAKSVKAQILPFGKEKKDAALSGTLQWNKESFTWQPQDEKGLAGQINKIAADAVSSGVTGALFQKHEAFKPYADRLQFEIAPMDAPERLPPNPDVLARIHFRAGRDGAPQLLHSYNLNVTNIFQPPAPDLGQAVANLQQAITNVQVQAHEALHDEVKSAVAKGPVRVKVKPEPNRITAPVDEVTFALTRRKGTSTLQARWSPKDLRFLPGEGWQGALDEALAPPAPGEKRPTALIGAVLAVVVVGGAYGGYVAFSGGDAPTPPINQSNANVDVANANINSNSTISNQFNANTSVANRNENTPPPEPPVNDNVVPPADDFSEALANAKAILAESSYLVPVPDEAVVVDPDDGGTRTVTARVPGLAESALVLPLEPAGDGRWRLRQEGVSRLRGAVSALNELAESNSGAVTAILAQIRQSITQQIDPRAIDFTAVALDLDLGTPPTWQADYGNDALLGTNGAVALTLTPEGSSAPEALGSIQIGLRIADGVMRLDPPDESTIVQAGAQQVGDWLSQRQQDRIAACRTQAQAAVANATVAVPTAATGSPILGVDIGATPAGMAARQATIGWDAGRLDYLDGSGAGCVQTVQAWKRMSDALAQLPSESAAWLGFATPQVIELQAPTGNTWQLLTRAPWADADAPLDELVANDRLIIDVPFSASDVNGETVAGLVSRVTAVAPAWRPLVAAYAGFEGGAGRLIDEASELTALADQWRTDGGATALADYLTSGQPVVLPQVTPDTGGTITAAPPGQPTSLSFPATVQWNVANLPAGLDAGVISTALTNLGLPGAGAVTLSMGANNQAIVGTSLDVASSGDSSLAVARLGALARAIDQYDARNILESELTQLAGGGGNVGVAQAFALLQRIWQAKGVMPRRFNFQSFAEFANELATYDAVGSKQPLGTDEIRPTVAFEFWCGMRSCFAVSWSQGVDGTVESGPFVQRLCSLEQLDRAIPGGGQSVGGLILDPPFQQMASALRGGNNRVLGIVIGADAFMAGPDWANVSITPVTTTVGPLDPNNSSVSSSWTRLNQLRNDLPLNRGLCDFDIYPSVLDQTKRARDRGNLPAASAIEPQRWAFGVLGSAAGTP